MNDIATGLAPLELVIQTKLIPAITSRPLNDLVWDLPARLGGIAIPDPCAASSAYTSSIMITHTLVDAILSQDFCYTEQTINQQLIEKNDVHKYNQELAKTSADHLKDSLPQSLKRPMELAQESGGLLMANISTN